MPRVVLQRLPSAISHVQGSSAVPDLQGTVLFYPFLEGSLLLCNISGLPGNDFYAFHIHEGGSCASGGDVSFQEAGPHFNPQGVPHPNHAGDLPVLMATDGFAWTLFYTGRFTPDQVIGKTMIIHQLPDDYRSQPAGASGARIGCGVIVRT
ncbi:MAG: superoxide dismutase family protein [Oscillospiraceae bacterium]|nr:superoxide dismutase family protein [Oscillospiraceae bacterium]